MIVGLTGGIASGKTVVSRLFSVLGASVFISDIAARDSYYDPEVKNQVITLLGKEAYISELEIDRKFISSIIFKEPALREKINELIHPQVGRMFNQFVKENKDSLIIKETALLFEANIAKECDKVIVVAADEEVRIKRICERDNVSRTEALERIKSQMPQDEKIRLADFVIHNNENVLLIPQVIALYEQLTHKNDTQRFS